MKSNIFLGILSLALVAGCSSPYAPAPQLLPEHIKKIALRPIVNNTTQYGLEEKFMLSLSNEFVRDGRLSLTNSEDQADSMLVTEIDKYILQPLTYDQNMITNQYKLWVLIKVSLIDKKNNVTLWTEPNMEGIQIYYDVTQPGGKSEEEVREQIWENFSTDIVKRTVDGFGSISGASEKKVPQ